jgi:hypothetical protein
MRIHPILYGVLVLTVFFGIILGFQAAGVWSISGKVDASGAAVAPSAGDVNTIKGWMTLDQISTTFNVPLAELFTQFSIPAETPATTAIKDLESDTFDTTLLRTWLESRAQAGSAPVLTATAQPAAATAVPVRETPAAPSAEITPAVTQHVALAGTVSGKTTFQELLDWGVTKEAIQKALGSDMPASTTVIKDYVTAKGLEFTAMKTLLQAEVDKLKP